MRALRLYVFPNRDGLLVCPEKTLSGTAIRLPDSRRRIFVSGDPDVRSLTHDQLNALVELAFRDPAVRNEAPKAVFYDGDVYAKRERRKILLTHTWA